MRQTAKSRILLYLVLVGAATFLTGSAIAQTTPADEAERVVPSNIPSLMIQEPNVVSIVIVLLSILAVTLIVQAFIRARREVLLPEQSTAQAREMIANRQFKDLIDFTEEDPSFVSKAINPALKRAPSFNAMKEAMETAVAEHSAEEFRKLEYLNILANVGPLLGLLGTVIGIMQAFLEMWRAGGAAGVEQLASGIAVALGTTMLGLMLAIPCLIAYGILRNKVDRLTTEGALEAEELLLMIKPSEAKPAAPARTTKPQPAATAPRKAVPATPPAVPAPAPQG